MIAGVAKKIFKTEIFWNTNTLKSFLATNAMLALALIGRSLLSTDIISDLPFLVFFLVIAASAMVGTFSMGLYATVVSALIAKYFFIEPSFTFIKDNLEPYFKLTLFFIEGTLLALLCAKLKESVIQTELTKRELARTATELKEALKSRDELIAVVSHELKTPLTSLKLQSQLTSRKIAQDSAAPSMNHLEKAFRLIDAQVNQLSHIVDDMLDMGRIRTGKMMMSFTDAEINNLVEDVVTKMAPQFASKEQLSFIRSKETKLYLDKYRIEQVITNLLSNALRYGRNSPVEVRVMNLTKTVLLTVKDSGLGISKEKIDRIFEKFERGIDNHESRGLGVGLFITKEIVQAHGGRIWVESEFGKGSTFFVELPHSSDNSIST